MVCVDVVVVCICVSSTDLFLRDSSNSRVDVVCVLFACRHVTAFPPCLCSLCMEKILWVVYCGCKTILGCASVFPIVVTG
jgi:hypothetical protein